LLDLDHLGAELAEERRTHGRGQERREIEHADAIERVRHEREGIMSP